MPELPEVETVRRGLAALVTGHQVVGVEERGERTVRRQGQAADLLVDLGRHGRGDQVLGDPVAVLGLVVVEALGRGDVGDGQGARAACLAQHRDG